MTDKLERVENYVIEESFKSGKGIHLFNETEDSYSKAVRESKRSDSIEQTKQSTVIADSKMFLPKSVGFKCAYCQQNSTVTGIIRDGLCNPCNSLKRLGKIEKEFRMVSESKQIGTKLQEIFYAHREVKQANGLKAVEKIQINKNEILPGEKVTSILKEVPAYDHSVKIQKKVFTGKYISIKEAQTRKEAVIRSHSKHSEVTVTKVTSSVINNRSTSMCNFCYKTTKLKDQDLCKACLKDLEAGIIKKTSSGRYSYSQNNWDALMAKQGY